MQFRRDGRVAYENAYNVKTLLSPSIPGYHIFRQRKGSLMKNPHSPDIQFKLMSFLHTSGLAEQG